MASASFFLARLVELHKGLVAFLAGDQGTHQVETHHVPMAPNAGVQAGSGLAQPLRLDVEVAKRQQEVGRGLLGVVEHGRVQGTNRVGELAAQGQLTTIEEKVHRSHGLDQLGCVILAVPARAVAGALEALGAAEVKCGRRVRT